MAATHNNLDLDLYRVETKMEEERETAVLIQPEEAEELLLLSSKEKETAICRIYSATDPFMFSARMEGVKWLISASTHLGFTTQTTILAVNYFDRFRSPEGRRRAGNLQSQPWLTQLCSVACLSLAAKVDETHVPLLLDLQVENLMFVFEPKTVQRMELLVLSTLGWRLNPVTPLNFVDYIVRRIASENHKKKYQLEFQRICQSILLSVIADSRWVEYLPSVMAIATMNYVENNLGFVKGKNQILSLLNNTTIDKEEVKRCYQFILDFKYNATNKRKDPDAIIDNPWSSIISSSSSSSPQHPQQSSCLIPAVIHENF